MARWLPTTNCARRRRTILVTLLLAGLAMGGAAPTPATAQPVPAASGQEPPPVSCIADNPVDPLGPGYLLERGRFTTIDHPDARAETQPFGNNNQGQIVGGYDTPGFVVRGFLLDRGRYTTIDVPGASRSFAARINARGQILGDYEDARGGCHGFLLEKGRARTIDVPGRPTQALGLNDRGHVVGMYRNADQVGHGFLYRDGAITTIDHPFASSDSWAQDLNDRGQIVGFYERGAWQMWGL